MSRKISSMILILLLPLSLFAATITFSGGRSSLSMREGKKEIVLSGGASVESGSLSIKSDTITLSGDDWRYVTCQGNIRVKDKEKGLEIRASRIWYDRVEELIIISSWFEIDDTKEELYAQGGSMRYSMKNDTLELGMQVELLKTSEGSVMQCTSESVTYNRKSGIVTLSGGARVKWKGDEYEAQVISVDTTDSSITLSGRIKGTING